MDSKRGGNYFSNEQNTSSEKFRLLPFAENGRILCGHIYILVYYYNHHRISHFSALAGKYLPIQGFSNQQH